MENKIERAGEAPTVTSLERGLRMLSAFSNENPRQTHKALVANTGLTKSTVSRLAGILLRTGYLQHDQHTSEYFLGTQILRLNEIFATASPFIERIDGALRRFAAEHGVIVWVGARQHLKIVSLCGGGSLSYGAFVPHKGTRVPMHITAMGRAYFCSRPEIEQTLLLDALKRDTPDDAVQIHASLERARQEYERLGACFAFGEWIKNLNMVAMPLGEAPGLGTLSIAAGGFAPTMPPPVIEKVLLPKLRLFAAEVARLLVEDGHAPAPTRSTAAANSEGSGRLLA